MRKSFVFVGILLVAVVLVYFGVRKTGEGGSDDNGATGGGGQQSSAIQLSSAPRVREIACADAIDNDGDRLLDCDDPDCSGNNQCRCNALSCGDPRDPLSTHTCLREEGCVCNGYGGCVACRQADQTCTTGADCCYGLNLECQEVVLGSGKRENRCLPSERYVCEIRCEGDASADTVGRWGKAESCKQSTTPPGSEDCALLTGACELAPDAERNLRKCWKS